MDYAPTEDDIQFLDDFRALFERGEGLIEWAAYHMKEHGNSTWLAAYDAYHTLKADALARVKIAYEKSKEMD